MKNRLLILSLVGALGGFGFGLGLPIVVAQERDGSIDPDIKRPGNPHFFNKKTERYVVTYFDSFNGVTNNSYTVITVGNESQKDCHITIEFFNQFASSTPELLCEVTLTAAPGQYRNFCSRGLQSDIAVCNSTCSPSIDAPSGTAIISTNHTCKDLGIDAKVYYTRGSNPDELITGVSNSNIKKLGKGIFPFSPY